MTKSSAWLSPEDYLWAKKYLPFPCVDVLLIDTSLKPAKILLWRRTQSHYSNEGETDTGIGKWCMPGGRIRHGETIDDAIAREAAKIKVVEYEHIAPFNGQFPAFLSDNPTQIEDRHVVTSVHPLKFISGSITQNGDEHDRAEWLIAKDALDKSFAYGHRTKLERALHTIRHLTDISI